MRAHQALEIHLQIDEAVRMEAALAAFDRLTAGSPPDHDDLILAPLLSGWSRTLVPGIEPVLIGTVDGHPHLPGRRRVATSRLLALDPAAGWARTMSRWYRLGSPAD